MVGSSWLGLCAVCRLRCASACCVVRLRVAVGVMGLLRRGGCCLVLWYALFGVCCFVVELCLCVVFVLFVVLLRFVSCVSSYLAEVHMFCCDYMKRG